MVGQSRVKQKRNSVATSNVETEFMAAIAAIKKAVWLQFLFRGLGCGPWSVRIHIDNQGCIQSLCNPVYSNYTKHIAVQFHFAGEAEKKGQVDVRYVESAKSYAAMMNCGACVRETRTDSGGASMFYSVKTRRSAAV